MSVSPRPEGTSASHDINRVVLGQESVAAPQ